MRHEESMVNDTRLPQSAACCLPSGERCKTTSYLTGYLIGQICGFRICRRHLLDTVCVLLRKDSIGALQQHVAVIYPADEDLMWESGTLGMDNPWALTRATFVTVGLHFCLRGGQEHRDLKVDQFCQVMALTASMNMLSTDQRTIKVSLLK